MDQLIGFVLGNFTLTFLVIGLICSLIALAIQPKPLKKPVVNEAFFSYFLLFSVGVSFTYNFVMHVFFADMAAAFIGWKNSPFQYEVGFASLGFGLVGLLAFRQKLGFRTAAVLGPACFQWGAAGGHVYQMVTAHNFAPGNAGIMFWSDVCLPIIGLLMLFNQYRYETRAG